MEIEDLKQRIFKLLPVDSIYSDELLNICDIKYSNEIETACVTVGAKPVMLLNQEFIEEHCKSDAHLLMLILHELYHIILGHTKLFKVHTLIDNIVFDAVINAILCKKFNTQNYTSFFTNANREDSFPGCLLRPLGKNTPARYKNIVKQLYKEDNLITYAELYDQFLDQLRFEQLPPDDDGDAKGQGKDKGNTGKGLGGAILLGNHTGLCDEDNDDELDGFASKLAKELTRKVKGYTTKITDDDLLDGIIGGSEDALEKEIAEIFEQENTIKSKYRAINPEYQKKMNRLIKRSCFVTSYFDSTNKYNNYEFEEQTSFNPNYRDRTVFAKEVVMGKQLLYKKEVSRVKRVDTPAKTLVYLDVSGSMSTFIDDIAPLLVKPYKMGKCKIMAFSTFVHEVTLDNIASGIFKSSGGTSIDCVMEHYFSLPKKEQPKSILIITDGYTERPTSHDIERIKKRKIKVYVGLVKNYEGNDLEDITTYYEEFK